MDTLMSLCCRRRANPQELEALRNQGSAQLKKRDLDGAIESFSKLLTLAPEDHGAWFSRSVAFRHKEDWESSARDAATALRLKPSDERSVYATVQALQKLGRTDEALKHCHDFLNIDPDNKPLVQMKKVLEGEANKPLDQTFLSATSSKTAAAPLAPKEELAQKYKKWKELEDSDDEREREKKAKAWKGRNPSLQERQSLEEQMIAFCRKTAEEVESSNLFPNVRKPENVKLPVDYLSPVGILTLEQLSKFNCKHTRQLVSLYGEVFDVSNRPDQYCYGGRLDYQAGTDITWLVISGQEAKKHCNRFFDIFKLEEQRCGAFMQIVCQKRVAFENEFGGQVGRLESYMDEQSLPPPPTEEIEECKQQ
eukprot:CAMPEP_0206472960 /NCGR_PEP_ID=MMETSP0324_2-20121206/32551_1 /ASSEMBLY_ACC=CAM_ASM_000836 /TAXON_ID=2866 /ORGANISM="Crypthecodinium cohnii, Strain Seligo" /LENGTH=365 /DNA_ID=CAMNT_0053947739 /DNA_START=19 /DNA_END=1116 /DNA_ORIENTATION=-